ncbi:MAG: SPOR domain-containing protein [Bacteroidales bacterium]|nr:SPOR domain-containing protein [Bacteroidales bacterium]
MRRVLQLVVVLLSVVTLATGCDFFRKLAGRPTSSEIEATREVIKLKTASPPAPVAVRDTVTESPEVSKEPVASVPQVEGKKRYYIVMASFSSASNASKYAERLSAKGYKPELFGFKGGFTGVGICGTDDEAEAKSSLKEVKRQDFCPDGVWILDRNKR